ncbi:hypothetical protein NLJ89_g1309 [Agrocybe chaxingu]|uniref:Uncharacterized protein n=1 Tax=Agrocybe chaxingu TaxID=84603 RepID=A0A9W8TFG2_9AGAR|nr:hypothetical protein NLJ89_g1309 [Agrocybe chaxingu]
MLPARPSASRSHARRTGGLSDYLTAPPSEFHEMDEEDDEFDSLMDNGNGVEGAGVNNDLYDAFASNPLPSWPPPTARRVTASPSPVSDEWHPPPLRSPTSATRPWSTLGSTPISNPSLLSRQASIRRAARSRVDFNEYSRARRSNLRDALTSHPEPAETVTEPRPSSQPGRRFFPFPRPRRSEASATAHWALVNDADDGPLFTPPWLDSDARYPSEPLTASPDSEGRDDNDTLIIRAPRLRRGGIRAPESMLSRHASPVVVPENAPPTPPPQPNPETIPVVPASEEPAAYPTPGSTESESFA